MSTILVDNHKVSFRGTKPTVTPDNPALLERVRAAMQGARVPGYSFNVDNDLAKIVAQRLKGEVIDLGKEYDEGRYILPTRPKIDTELRDALAAAIKRDLGYDVTE
jgi:hypothetical protein